MAKADDKVKETNVQEQTENEQPVAVDIEAIKAELLKEVKAEAKAELLEEMKKETAKEKGTSVPMTKKEIEYWDEKVSYHVPWIEGEEEEITVGHNGKLYKVKRGEDVEIPRKILDILLNSEKQKRAFAEVKKGLKNQEIQA